MNDFSEKSQKRFFEKWGKFTERYVRAATHSAEQFAYALSKSSKQYEKAITHFLISNEKEATTTQVTYNGFTGELVRLERIKCPPLNGAHIYDISIYDDENRCTHSFTGVKLEDVKFSGGAVTFGG